jgi:hypothetical protein
MQDNDQRLEARIERQLGKMEQMFGDQAEQRVLTRELLVESRYC